MEHLASSEDVRAVGDAIRKLKRDAVRRMWPMTILVSALVTVIDRSLG